MSHSVLAIERNSLAILVLVSGGVPLAHGLPLVRLKIVGSPTAAIPSFRTYDMSEMKQATMSNTKSSKPSAPRKLTIHLSGQTHHLSVERAFSLAHQLLCRGKLDAATSVLAWLEQTLPEDRRVKVLHARCEARLGHFAECSQLLNQGFVESSRWSDVPGPLHAALVYRATGLLPDARHELKELCSRHPELPSLWLLAGDLWLAVGRADKAQEAWNIAARHDYAPSLIATTARHRIQELAAMN